MRKKRAPLPWYAGPFIALLAFGGAIGIMVLTRDSEKSTMAVLVILYMALVVFGVRGIYAVWKNTDNNFLITLDKITKIIMITFLFVAVAGIIWIWIAKPDSIMNLFSQILKDLVNAVLPSGGKIGG